MWIPILLVVTFLGDRLMAYGLKQLADRSNFRYSDLYTGRAEADVVFIGNSRGLNFYQPEFEKLRGRSSLNLSYNGMPTELIVTFLEDYLDRYEAPEDLVVEVTFLGVEDDGVLVRDFRVYSQYSARLDSLLHAADNKIAVGTKVAHLSRYGGEVAQRMFYYLTKDDADWMVDREIAPSMAAAAAELPRYRIDYKLERIHRLNEVLKRYQAAGSRVGLTINPYYPAFQRTVTNLDSLSLDVRNITGLPVYDYSASVTGDENFGDYRHLNKDGARVYMGRLVEDLNL